MKAKMGPLRILLQVTPDPAILISLAWLSCSSRENFTLMPKKEGRSATCKIFGYWVLLTLAQGLSDPLYPLHRESDFKIMQFPD